MIYTIGNRETYPKSNKTVSTVYKVGRRPDYPGGAALKSREDAERLITELGEQETYAVYGLDAVWEQDTYPASDGWWHYLLRDARIIVLPEKSS